MEVEAAASTTVLTTAWDAEAGASASADDVALPHSKTPVSAASVAARTSA
jgi:hypothetical protein